MNPLEICNSLCSYDMRNPSNMVIMETDIYLDTMNNEFKTLEQQKDCACDNCFYGRTKLANAFLDYISTHSRPNKVDKDSEEERQKNWDIVDITTVELCPDCQQPNKQIIRHKSDKKVFYMCTCNFEKELLINDKKPYLKQIIHESFEVRPFQNIIGKPKETDIQ